MTRAGTGTLSVLVRFQHSTAAEVEDLSTGLPVSDLRAGGWAVKGPGPGPGGTTQVTASHAFSSLSQLPTLMADMAGAGPPGTRPFRLSVRQSPGTLRDTFNATGGVDLSCSLSCFDDPRLAGHVGYPLGLSPAQLARLLGPAPGRHLTFYFRLSLPGSVTASNAAVRLRSGELLWVTPLGRDTTLYASSQRVDEALVHQLIAAIAGGVLLVMATAALLLRRRRQRTRPGPKRDVVTRPR